MAPDHALRALHRRALHQVRRLTNPFDPAEPEIVLAEGTEPDSKVVGLSYLAFAGKERRRPTGSPGERSVARHESLSLGSGACAR